VKRSRIERDLAFDEFIVRAWSALPNFTRMSGISESFRIRSVPFIPVLISSRCSRDYHLSATGPFYGYAGVSLILRRILRRKP